MKWNKDYQEAIKRVRNRCLSKLIGGLILMPWFIYLVIFKDYWKNFFESRLVLL